MDVITSIKKERGKMRVTISEADEIVVPVSLFRERPLEEGQSIDMDEYDQWLMLRQYRHALDKAVAFLASRARSRKEMEEKLLRCGYRPCTVEMVLYKLETENLLDDADFAKQWVEARVNHKLGRNRIAQELRRKGISADEAEAAMEDIDPDDQLSAAITLVEKALTRTRPGEDPRKTASRITAMLARRGFGWDVAREAISQAMSSLEDEP